MEDIQFVGDVNDLSDEQRGFIARVVKKRGFKNVTIDVQPVDDADNDYVDKVRRITVEKDGEIFKMIAKVAPKDEIRRNVGNSALLFLNEHIMYTQVLPKFTALENAANISEEERFRYAACYGTYMEAPNEIILLEDLQVYGFKILDRLISLTDENVRLVLKDFAKFHSLSYALKKEDPETFHTFCDNLANFSLLLKDDPELIDWCKRLDADVHALLDDDKYKNAVKNAISRLIAVAAKLAKIDTYSKHSVIQQGDIWMNNIMFRLENDAIVKCCMIDYQVSKQSSPVADLHYMIFNCTDHATRANHFHDWIDYYHLQLDESLANFRLKANYIYPRHKLDADLRNYAKVSLGQAIIWANTMVRAASQAARLKEIVNAIDDTTEEDMSDLAKQAKVFRSFISVEEVDTEESIDEDDINEKLKVRIKEIVDSFIELGYM